MVWGSSKAKSAPGGSSGSWCGIGEIPPVVTGPDMRTPPLVVGQVARGGMLPCNAVGPKVEPKGHWPQFDNQATDE